MKPVLLLLNPPYRLPVMRDYYCSSTSKAGYLWPPIDLICQSGFLTPHYDLRLIDAPTESLLAEATLRRIAVEPPAIIYSLVGTAAYPDDFAFLQRVSDQFGCRIFISGDVARFYPQWILDHHPFIEGLLLNFATPALRDYLVQGTKNCEALALRNEKAETAPQAASDFNYPIPAHGLFHSLPYRMPFLGRPFGSVLTNYGCPFRCDFCNSCRIGYCERERDNLFEELDFFRSSGIKHLFVKDMTFNPSARRAIMLLEEWREKKFDFNWTGYFRAEQIDAELAALLKKTSCRMAQIGIETANQQVLEEHKPGANLEEAIRGMNRLKQAGVPYGAHFIFGLPGDNSHGFARTIDFARQAGLSYASFNLFTPRLGSNSAPDSPEPARLQMDPSRPLGGEAAFMADLDRWVRKANVAFYLRPGYLLSVARSAISARSFFSALAIGWRFLRAGLRSKQ